MLAIKKQDIKGKRVIIRVDFNVPLDKEFSVVDDSRIVASLPTIKKITDSGGRAVLISHMGRPNGKFEESLSLKHVIGCLSSLIGRRVLFNSDCVGDKVLRNIDKMKNGDVMLLENLRFYAEEEEGDENFAKELAKIGDIYINDAFGTAHRTHASTTTITNYFKKTKYFGLLLASEIKSLKHVTEKPQRPFTAIIGGAKILGKITVLKALIKKVDNLIIGGGMAYTFIMAQGGEIGDSLVEKDKLSLALNLIELAKKEKVNLFLPVDSINASSFNNNARIQKTSITKIPQGYMGMDIGEKSVERFAAVISDSKTIVWNGPMGVFEMDNFEKGTRQIAQAICRSTECGSFSFVGGGDSVSAIKKFRLDGCVSYVSTGGGAMLKYLEGEVLPAISAINC